MSTLMLNLLAAGAEFEWGLIGEGTRAGLAKAKREGRIGHLCEQFLADAATTRAMEP